MNSGLFQLRPLALAVAALVAVSGLSADSSYANPAYSPGITDDSGNGTPGPFTVVNLQGPTDRYIVRFKEQPLALYNDVLARNPNAGVSGVGAIPLKLMANGRSRLDVKSSQAQAYVQYLKQQQTHHLSDIATALGQAPAVTYSMQHALNAVILKLTPQQATQVAKLADVAAVERDHPQPLATDIGPGFIGAASVWWGTPAGQDTMFADGFEGTGFRGDGMVIGDIDTGYNSASPSFSATDASGYTITNPLGTGNFIGQCAVPNISIAGCNDKVIGVYDEINLTGSGPPYSVEDTQSHGSHTASTAGGNGRSASLAGYTANISGVAPHANLVIYYACSPDVNVQCSTAATSGSVDQAIADGVVDALNYSISGGNDPWDSSTSLAFLSAADAGIFIAAAAGNTSASVPNQVPGTANHAEPWVTTVAASTHTGGSIAPSLSITGPGTPPANLQNMGLTAGTGGVAASAPFTGPAVLSPAFSNLVLTGTDGCTASGGYAAGLFTGAVAIISRGTCAFSEKVNNATTAGALAVVISDNRVEGPLTPSVPGTTIPVYTVLQSQGTDLKNFLSAQVNSTGSAFITFPPSRLPTQPDVLAGFSLLGPVSFDLLKPDVEAPGVNILAAYSNDGTAGGPARVGLLNGTSMATPHTTGSGVLMLGVNTDWSPMEAKSALMMTAKEAGLTKANGTTPSDYFDRGSGRLQDFIASKSGLTMNETGLNFANADPAIGGDPSTLNIASMQSASCITGSAAACTFTRKFRSTQNHAVTWAVTFTGNVTATATPSSLIVPARTNSQGQTLTVNVDASSYNSDGVFHFGEMTLTPSDANLTPLHLPMAIKVPPPKIAAAPSPLSIVVPAASTTNNAILTVSNIGGPTLNVTNTNQTTGSTRYVYVDQSSQGNNGYFNTFFTDLSQGSYASDDFDIKVSGANLTKISVPGFTPSGGPVLTTLAGHGIHFRIYGNNSGLPNGDPQGITSATPAVYSFNTTVGSPGLSVAGDTISLDLAAAAAPATNLAAGTYWLVVYADEDSTVQAGWAQFVTTQANGNNGAEFGPLFTETVWSPITDAVGFAMHVEAQVPCGAAWLSAAPSTLTLGAGASAPLTVTADSSLFPVPSGASAYLCLASNDPVNPVFPVLVNATKTAVSTAPSVSKSFTPSSVLPGANSTATLTLSNPNASIATLTANLVDTLPSGLVATAASAATTCAGGTAGVQTGGGSVTLTSGAQIPATGSCTVTFTVTAASPGSYANTIAAGALQTSAGNNAAPGSATLTVLAAPTITKDFAPASVSTGVNSTATLTLSNTNAVVATLTATLVDTLPANLVATAGSAATTCFGGPGVGIAGGGGSVALAPGAQIPASGSCTVTFTVSSSVAAPYTNTIAAGGLQTDAGSNAVAASAVLTVNVITYTVTPSVPGGNGTIAPSTPQTVNNGSTQAFTLTPAVGYLIGTTTGTCGGTLVGNVFTTNPVVADCTVIANFTLAVCTTLSPVEVKASAGTPGPTGYPTLKAGFDAINAGTHQGAISVDVCTDTTEAVPAVLNVSGGASSYTAISIKPAGGAARTVSGAIVAGSPLIDLAGANNVTIDGLNSAGNALTLSNTTASNTASTSTIRFINGASNNTVTRTTVLGSSTSTTATAGGNIFFSTSTVAGGNSNNTISANNIGPAGANLPTKGVMSLGTLANPNAGNVINGNNIFDFFQAAVTSAAGVSVSTNTTTITISNNRIYQTAPRVFTAAGSVYSGIFVSAATAVPTITGNVIGFGAANGTGTTTISGSSNQVKGINAPSTSTAAVTSIQGNTISGINQTTSAGTTSTNSGFIGISVGAIAGSFNIGGTIGNTIGSLDASTGIVVNNTTVTTNSWGFIGIFDFSFQNLDVISNNNIGTITINNGGTGTGAGFRGIRNSQTAGVNTTISNNIIGGVAAGSITDNVVGTYNMYGIDNTSANLTCVGNVIRNISGNANAAGFISISGIILSGTLPTGVSTISQNTIHSLSDNSTPNNGAIYAIYGNFPATANVVERNFVHSLSITSTNLGAQLAGVLAVAGSATYKNNMVRLGVDASGADITTGYTMYGMFDIAGTNNLYNNSVYVGGTGVASSGNTFAFVSNVVTNVRNYEDNIFWNARSNASGAGKNYAIAVAGTTPNPAGLTSGFNDLLANGTGGFTGLFNAIDQTTLADWQTATGQDAGSFATDPQFIAPTGTAATVNLHIHPTNPTHVEGTGLAIPAVTDDFDGDVRASFTPTDVGADAGDFVFGP